MNTGDVSKEQISASSSVEDKLESIFAGQKELMADYKKIAEDHYRKIFGQDLRISDIAWSGRTDNLHTKVGNFLIKDMIDSSMHELSEAVQVMKNWKSWKQTEMMTDVDHFKEEMIDALHFYVEACLLAGITAKEVHGIYFKKHAVNKFRQRSSY